MQKPKNFRHLDIKAWAKSKMALEGQTSLAELTRLAQDCIGNNLGQVAWSAQAAMAPDPQGKEASWLHVQAQTAVPLTCQRCLHPVPIEILIDRDFRFVTDEMTALAEDDESTEDLLVLEDGFDLIALIEDELLMDLPLVPMHASCQSTQQPPSPQEMAVLLGTKPNPFAVLAKLKTPKP